MDRDHLTSDAQSLRLTAAALASLSRQPALMQQVLATLDHWDCVAAPQSQGLRDEWRRILASREWSRALDPGPRGQQLRQTSPLGKALDPAQRLVIIRSCKGRNSNT
jgi:hypothetical protein